MGELVWYKQPVFGNWEVMCKGTPHRHLEISIEVGQAKRDKISLTESGIANAVLETTGI